MAQNPPAAPGTAPSFVDRLLPPETDFSGAAPVAANNAQLAPSVLSWQTLQGMAWRQRYVIAACLVVALVSALVVTLLAQPLYQASATVRYDPPGMEIIEGQTLGTYVSTNEVSREIATLASTVKSRSMALAVVDDLKLYDEPLLLGEMLTNGKPAGVSDEAWQQQRRDVAAAIIRGGLSVDTPFETRVMTLNLSAANPAVAARVVNGYARQFVQQDIVRGVEANSYAKQYLEEQIAEVRARLGNAETTSINYARRNRIIAAPAAPGGGESEGASSGTAPTLTGSNLSNISGIYTQARAERIEAEQRWRAVANVPAAEIPEVQTNATVISLENELATKRGQLSDLRQRYQDDFPEVRQTMAQIASLEGDLGRARNQVKNGIRNAYQVALRQEQALQSEVGSVSNQALDEQSLRVQYSLIDRDVEALRDQLEALLTRYNQLTSASNLRTSTLTVLDEAQVPGAPYSPNIVRYMLIGLVAGIGSALALAILREILDHRIRSVEDVEQQLGLRALGQTPFMKGDITASLDDALLPVSEAYASIRATIDFVLAGSNRKVIQVTSGSEAEGKTTTVVALAARYAALGRKTLVIDMDLRRPSVAKAVGLAQRPAFGLLDVLQDHAMVPKAVVPGPVNNLDLLLVTERPENPALVLSSGLVHELIEYLRPRYDMILIDSAPVLGLADAPLLSRFVDATVFVIEANGSHVSQIKGSLRRLRAMSANIIGVTLTKYQAVTAGQNYSAAYRYYTYNKE